MAWSYSKRSDRILVEARKVALERWEPGSQLTSAKGTCTDTVICSLFTAVAGSGVTVTLLVEM